MLNDVVYGGLEEGIHGVWTHPQHPLRRPFNKVHTTQDKMTGKCVSNLNSAQIHVVKKANGLKNACHCHLRASFSSLIFASNVGKMLKKTGCQTVT